jgi:ketosteroid isomerase-like protein
MTRYLFIAVALLFVASAPARASEATAIMATITHYNDSVNVGDSKTAATYLVSSPTIIDEFAPYIWTGPSALQEWSAGFETWMTAGALVDPTMKLGKAEHVTVDGDHAYAVVSGQGTFKVNGKTMHENGVFAFAMQKIGADWKIVASSWALE